VQQRFLGPGEFGAQRGDGVPLDGRTAGEADVLQLADGGAGAVAADQVTAAPPGALGAAGTGGDAGRLLLDAVEPAVHGDPHQPFIGQCRAQGAGQDVLGDVHGRRVVEGDLAHHLLAPHRPPSGPTAARLPDRQSGQTLHQGGAVLAQDDGACQAGFVLAGSLVENDRRHLLTCQCQGEREPDGPRSDDDHRVHGVVPPARSDVPGDACEQEVGAGCTITERMQPIAGACVK
jgi:hypothetical protein